MVRAYPAQVDTETTSLFWTRVYAHYRHDTENGGAVYVTPSFGTEVSSLTSQFGGIPADLDEGALREIANATGGKFFRAFDTDTMESSFKAIDRAQKIEFQAKSYLLTTELFAWPAAPGLGALALAALFARPAWRKEAIA